MKLLRTYGTAKWEPNLTDWQAIIGSLRARYARERKMNEVPLQLAEGRELYLTPGGITVGSAVLKASVSWDLTRNRLD